MRSRDPVGEPDTAARRGGSTQQFQPARVVEALEQPPARGVEDRTDRQLQLVYEARGEERLRQFDAAVDADVTAGASLEVTQDFGYRTGTASTSPHEFVSGVDVTTYFLTLFMKSANGCSSDVGQ